jgi:hypothetical protein
MISIFDAITVFELFSVGSPELIAALAQYGNCDSYRQYLPQAQRMQDDWIGKKTERRPQSNMPRQAGTRQGC